MSEEQEVAKHISGKPWKNESFFKTFEEADQKRNQLLEAWNDNKQHEGMQVKVRYLSSRSQFVVKTRLHPDFEPVKKEKKKNVKRNKKNKRNNVDGKFDPQRSD